MSRSEHSYRRVLSLDGGGLRGIYPATILSEIEGVIGNGRLYQYFDLVVGASTGAIIGIALACGIPAKQIASLFESARMEIFGKPRSFASVLFLGGPRHNSRSLHRLLQQLLGNRTLGESLTRLCVPTLGLHSGRIKVLKTPHLPEFFADQDLLAWKAAAASSAAPTYLAPVSLREGDAFVDGGTWANHPGLLGVVEARRLGWSLDSVRVLSLGTGRALCSESSERVTKWGYVGWGRSMFGLLAAAHQQAIDVQMRSLGLERYYRIDQVLNRPQSSLDDPRTCLQLIPLARQAFQDHFHHIRDDFFEKPTQGWRRSSGPGQVPELD